MTKKILRKISKEASLTHAEQGLLWAICKRQNIGDDKTFFLSEQNLNNTFNAEYNTIKSWVTEEKKQSFFNLRFKLEKAIDNAHIKKRTANLKQGQVFTWKDSDGNDHNLTLLENGTKRLVLSVAEDILSRADKPAVHKKFLLSLKTEDGQFYTLSTKGVRYTAESGKTVLYTSGTSALRPMLRRRAKRLEVHLPCNFSAAKKHQKLSAHAAETETYELSYEGVLEDISATGCRLRSKIPVLQKQALLLRFSLTKADEHFAAGSVVATKKSLSGEEYILHIMFTNIPIATQNTIYAFIYGGVS